MPESSAKGRVGSLVGTLVESLTEALTDSPSDTSADTPVDVPAESRVDSDLAAACGMLSLLARDGAASRIVGWRDNLEKAVCWREFVARVEAWRVLVAWQPGTRCALHLADSIEFGAALFGAWHAGKTVYLPGDNLPATCAGLAESVDFFLGQFPPEYAPVAPMESGVPAGAGVDADSDLAAAYPALNGDFVGLVVYTSGSTGAAQAIPKHLSQMAAEVATLEAVFGAQLGTAEVVATVSHQHIYGLLFKVLWPLCAGRALHARSLIFPEELAVLLNARDCVLVSSPAHLKRLPGSTVWTNAPPWPRAVFSSGGPLALEDSRAAAQLLGRIPIEVYGSSETGGIAWRQQASGHEAWRPMPVVEWRIDAQEDLLEVRSAYLFDSGWLRLSDRVMASEGGFLLQGRVDRIVKIEEKRISLDRIESVLCDTPWVVEARALVLEGKRQRVGVVIVPSAAGTKLLAERGKLALNLQLREVLAVAIEAVALPRRWRYVQALPVDAQGKTTQSVLRALFAPPIGATLPQLRVLAQGVARVVVECRVPADLVYFEGHFADAPVLPGIVLVEWAMAVAQQHFAALGTFLGVRALKFHAVVTPGMCVTLELMYDADKSVLTFRFDSTKGAHGSGKIMLSADLSTIDPAAADSAVAPAYDSHD